MGEEELTGTQVEAPKALIEKARRGRKAKRVPKDPVFKELISLYFTDQSLTDFTINPGLQVGQTQLEIDIAVRAAETLTHDEIQTRLKDTPFFFFAYLNVLEFKSANDKLDLADFYRIAARALLAAAGYYERQAKEAGKGKRSGRIGKKQPQSARVVSCLICANYPQSVQDQLQTPFQPIPEQPKGFYFRPHASELFLPSYLLVCNELPMEEKYYPLLVFATGNKLQKFIELLIDLELEVYIKYVAKLHTEEVQEAFEDRIRKGGGQMTAGEARLADTIADILGIDGLAKVIVRRLKSEGADFNDEQRLNLLRALMPHLSEEELEALLAKNAAKQK